MFEYVGDVFSPRAWGWSVVGVRRDSRSRRSPHVRGDGPAMADERTLTEGVLPTCVGMVRHATLCRLEMGRSPHVRGDGPGAEYDHAIAKYVLPTCVGMVRG